LDGRDTRLDRRRLVAGNRSRGRPRRLSLLEQLFDFALGKFFRFVVRHRNPFLAASGRRSATIAEAAEIAGTVEGDAVLSVNERSTALTVPRT
jgi:hypothetical protein